MSGINKVFILGNLVKDPELKQLDSGSSVCDLRIATNRKYKNKSGDVVEEVTYIDVGTWGREAENCHQYLRKGSQVIVEGRLKTDNWQDADGNNRSKLFVHSERVHFTGGREND